MNFCSSTLSKALNQTVYDLSRQLEAEKFDNYAEGEWQDYLCGIVKRAWPELHPESRIVAKLCAEEAKFKEAYQDDSCHCCPTEWYP